MTFNNLKLRPFFMRRCSIFQSWIHRRLTGGLVAGGGGAEAIRGSGRKGRAAGGYKGSHINQYISPELHSMPEANWVEDSVMDAMKNKGANRAS